MKCPNCQTTLPEGSQFCNQCGSKTVGGDPVSGDPASSPPANIKPPATQLRDDVSREDRAEEVDREKTLWEGAYSGKSMLGTWILAILGTVVLCAGAGALHVTPLVAFAPFIWAITGGAIVIMWLYLFGLMFYRKWSVQYELTDQRLIHRVGILSRQTYRIELLDVDDVSFKQGFIERMAGVGSILITSSDESHPELWLIGISQVEQISDLIDNARRKERRRRGLHIETI